MAPVPQARRGGPVPPPRQTELPHAAWSISEAGRRCRPFAGELRPAGGGLNPLPFVLLMIICTVISKL